MDLQGISVIIACFLSVYLGIFTAILAEEELKDALKYLRVFQNLLITLTSYVLFYPYIKLYAILVSIAVLLVMFNFKSIRRDLWIYPILGIVIGVNSSIMMVTLVFLYGFPSGSILYEKFKNKAYIQTFYYISFIFMAIVVSYL